MGRPGSQLPPIVHLIIFCTLNLLIYADRGASSSNGVNALGLQREFALTLFQDGLLPAAFLVGLLFSSPIFAEASKHSGAFKLMGVGLAVWAVSILGCALSVNFGTLLLCRMGVGVGEASFVALASPFIDDNAPPKSKARWLATFYLCVPVGYALGFIYGGLISAAFSWRAAYFLESLAVLPFIIFFFLAPNVDLRGTHEAAAEFEAEEQERHHTHGTFQARLEEASRDVARMVESPVYVSVVGGMTFYAAVIGAYAFYGPQAGKDAYSVDPETADLAFGGITVLSGVIGTLAGGILLDVTGSTLRNGCLLCAAGLTLGGALVIAAFALSQTFTQFCVVFGLGEAAMFSTAAPSNAVAMWSVPSGLRPLGMSLSVVAMHVLGDVPSPPIMGLVQGRLQNWKLTMSLAAVFLFVGAAVYCVGAHAAKRAIDYRAVGAQPGSSGRMHAEYTAAPGEEEGDGHMPPEVESLSP